MVRWYPFNQPIGCLIKEIYCTLLYPMMQLDFSLLYQIYNMYKIVGKQWKTHESVPEAPDHLQSLPHWSPVIHYWPPPYFARNWLWTCFLAGIRFFQTGNTFVQPNLVPIYTCLPSTRNCWWICFLARIPFIPNWYTIHFFPPPQTGAHLYMPALHPKLIRNLLPGMHSLHPKLGTQSLCSHYCFHPKLLHIYTYLLPSAPNWYWMCFLARIPVTLNLYMKPMWSSFAFVCQSCPTTCDVVCFEKLALCS